MDKTKEVVIVVIKKQKTNDGTFLPKCHMS
jgi:hypothetical protein